ncbi:hypothetical protein XENTR_v10006889 [Xenopus tropicalis]|uniref:Tripartite motif containing 13 n=1 Tax=Xenopus tropicalis TaxID=8364 RepID=A0A8J0R0X9_XENTR|nr:tripartite motif containing 13 [Xenopus tropicalis]KAE8627161.1 hypothetical protein XENTR_v10006889 [Xenopus tropicalis]
MDVMEVLEEDLTCPICCSLFDDPRVLPCSHNFCKKCLDGVLEENSRTMQWRPSSFKCPTCRKETPTMGVNGLQVNYLLKGIVEKYNKIKVSPKMPVCKEHSDQPLNIFCSTDLKLICGSCATTGEHKKHVFSSIGDAYIQEKSSLETLFQGVEEWNSKEVHSHLDTLESNKRKALHSLAKESDKVKAYFEKLQYLLEQKKNEILSDFETLKLAVMQAYDTEINKLHTVLSEQRKACNIVEDLKNISDPFMFLQQMQEFRDKMSFIKEAPLTTGQDVNVNPAMKEFDTSMWDSIKLGEVDKLSLPQDITSKKEPGDAKTLHSLKPILVVACLILLLVTFLCAYPFIDSLPTFTIDLQVISSYFFTTTAKAANLTILFWEQLSEELLILKQRCQTYVSVFLENVAEFVCKYKL